MKKPVRRIDQQLIVVSGRSLISGADMCLGRRLYSSMYAAITDGLVGENTRYETGSLLSRSVPRMRAEVCLHTGLCLRPQLGGSTGRVVVFHGQLVVVGCAPLQKLRVSQSHILSCPTLDAPTRRFDRAAKTGCRMS